MEKLLVICDCEKTYGKRLYEYLLKRQATYYRIKLYTSVNAMIEGLSGSRISILMIDEISYAEFVSLRNSQKLKIDKIKILSSNKSGPGLVAEDSIYKYMPAKDILNTIVAECGFDLKEKPDDSNKYKKSYSDDFKKMRLKVKKDVQEKLLLSDDSSDEEVYRLIDKSIKEKEEEYKLKIDLKIKNELKVSVFNSIRRLDVLQGFLDDDGISEIMVNGEDNIFIEKEGRLIFTRQSFDSRETLYDIIQKIVAGANRTVNMSSPIVDARLPDGSRVNVVLEPISLSGPILTIRRFPKETINCDRLIELGAVSSEIMLMLKNLVMAGYNILISGSTGAGKTTLLNVLSSFIPHDERIVTIEDAAELSIIGIKNLVRLEARNANTEGCKEISIRDLIKTALRMRPDRIIVGECRGKETIDMLQAMSVGMDGSMSTIHANSANDALLRLEMLLMMNMDIPVQALRRQIASSVDIVIQLSRLKDKSRKLLEIIEVLDIENGMIKTSPLYAYKNGEFIKMNDIQNTYKLEKAGIYGLQDL